MGGLKPPLAVEMVGRRPPYMRGLNMQRKRGLRLVALVAVLGLASGVVVAAERGAATHAPRDVITFLGIDDLDACLERMEGSRLQRFLSDEELAERLVTFDLIMKALEKTKERVAESLGVPASQLKNPFGGACGVLMTDAGLMEEEALPDVVAFLGVKDRALMREYYDKAIKRMEEAADEKDVESFRGSELHIFTTQPKETGDEEEDFWDEEDLQDPAAFMDEVLDDVFSAESMPPTLVLCLTDDQLLVGLTVDGVKRVMRQEAGESLAENPDYRRIDELFPRAQDVRLFVNVPRLIELALETAAREGEADEVRQAQEVLGLDSFGPLIGHMSFNVDEQCDQLAEAQIMLRGRRSGLAELLSLPNERLEPPATVSADSIGFAALHFEPVALYDGVMRMLRQVDPDSADEVRRELEALELEPGKTINLRDELLAKLRGPLMFMQSFKRPYDADSGELLVTMGHRDRAALQQVMALFPFFMERDLRGAVVYDQPFIPGVCLAMTQDQLLIGITAAVERAATGERGRGLAGEAAYRRAARAVADEGWFIGYSDERKKLEAVMGLMENREAIEQAQFGNMQAGLAMALIMEYVALGEDVQPADLRPLREYLGQQIVVFRTVPDGIQVQLAEVVSEE